MAGWVRWASDAARVKLRTSATATNDLSWSSSIALQIVMEKKTDAKGPSERSFSPFQDYCARVCVESLAGGKLDWRRAREAAGYDGLIVEGKADAPVYLWINDGTVGDPRRRRALGT